MIKVYQIVLSDQEQDLLNAEGWNCSHPKIQAYGRRGLGKVEDVNMEFYSHVANCFTINPEYAFDLMNLWNDDELVETLQPCRSMSVGDVVEMEDGHRFLCVAFGFEEIV